MPGVWMRLQVAGDGGQKGFDMAFQRKSTFCKWKQVFCEYIAGFDHVIA